MVLSQAMACGCVVIATEHTGALDLYQDGQAGFIVPVRDGAAIADRMQMLADDPSRRMDMSQRAIQAVQGAGGWKDYGDAAMAVYQQLLEH